MNDKKVCFISCVNDHELYREALYYINQLEVPDGFEIECISIENAQSMTQGYNQAMKKTDAKYKVYLHQDVFIINKSFIKDIIDLFRSYPKVGMLGVVGAKVMSTNGIWWESLHKTGKFYDSHTGKMAEYAFGETDQIYEAVQAIDGLIMATQYDTSWREDLFDGWHFYDISQSIEFKRAGYEIAVPYQEKPWCVHDCGIVNVSNGYEHYRNVFLNEYSKDLFPLVSILIPTHNRPHYFKIALESALNQTYRNIEIIVSDNSDDEETKNLIQGYLGVYSNLKYFFNSGISPNDNIDLPLQQASGEYINYLFDDDYFHIEKIEKMMNCFLEYEDISLVTSHRQVVDKHGNYFKDISSTAKLFHEDTLLDGKTMGNFVLQNQINVIGEPTTVLHRKGEFQKIPLVYYDRVYLSIADVATWLKIMKNKKCVYVSETLSYFRMHDEQLQNAPEFTLSGYNEWLYLINKTYEDGSYIESESEYETAVLRWLKTAISYVLKSDKALVRQCDKKILNELYENIDLIFRKILL